MSIWKFGPCCYPAPPYAGIISRTRVHHGSMLQTYGSGYVDHDSIIITAVCHDTLRSGYVLVSAGRHSVSSK